MVWLRLMATWAPNREYGFCDRISKAGRLRILPWKDLPLTRTRADRRNAGALSEPGKPPTGPQAAFWLNRVGCIPAVFIA